MARRTSSPGTGTSVARSTAATAPDDRVGASGFQFDRLGARVPTILVSPYVAAGTVFRSPDSSVDLDHMSFIATMLKWAGVEPSSAGLGARVAVAPTFEGALTTTARTDKPSFTVPSGYKDHGGGTGSGPGLITAPATMDIKQLRHVLEASDSADDLTERLASMPDAAEQRRERAATPVAGD